MRKSGDMASADAICPRILSPHSILETRLSVLAHASVSSGWGRMTVLSGDVCRGEPDYDEAGQLDPRHCKCQHQHPATHP